MTTMTMITMMTMKKMRLMKKMKKKMLSCDKRKRLFSEKSDFVMKSKKLKLSKM